MTTRTIRRRVQMGKGRNAFNADGFPVQPQSQDAVCFCLFGGIIHCYGPNEEGSIARSIVEKLRDALGEDSLSVFNDDPNTTIKQIRDLVTRADV